MLLLSAVGADQRVRFERQADGLFGRLYFCVSCVQHAVLTEVTRAFVHRITLCIATRCAQALEIRALPQFLKFGDGFLKNFMNRSVWGTSVEELLDSRDILL